MMDNSPQNTNSLVPLMPELESETSGLKPSDDQYFLLYLIMSTYFGPDLIGETPQKCAFQRLAEGLPLYASDKLSNSYIKTIEVERIYYYVLRKADQSVVVKQAWLHQFFHGHLPSPGQDPASTYPQFPDIFPLQLHPHSRFKNSYKIIENIVFINNPDISYLTPEVVERFKRLTRLEDFLLDRDSAMLHTCVSGDQLYNVEVQEVKSIGELASLSASHGSERRGPSNGSFPDEDYMQNSTNNSTPMMHSNMALFPYEPGMVFLPSPPTREDWKKIATATKRGSALTGTAVMGHVGPVVGLMDIGECEDSYLFRVSLPGVVRDEREFSCEVENDGKVLIKGVTTTGERIVHRYSQEFEMQTQNLCPPGDFSISFKLPGPVDPQQFSGNFGTDGILEGIIMKAIQRSG